MTVWASHVTAWVSAKMVLTTTFVFAIRDIMAKTVKQVRLYAVEWAQIRQSNETLFPSTFHVPFVY